MNYEIPESRLKTVIFNKLTEDLKDAEIIPYNNSIWFVNREKKYWYLVYNESGNLLYKLTFFNSFFDLFSLDKDEYEPIIAEWVESKLNCEVSSMRNQALFINIRLEKVLNSTSPTT